MRRELIGLTGRVLNLNPVSVYSAQPHWRNPGSLQVMIEFGPCCSVLGCYMKKAQRFRWKPGQALSHTLESELAGEDPKRPRETRSSCRITEGGRESPESIASASYVPLRGTYKEARMVDVLCELRERTQFSLSDKQEASLSQVLFFLTCCARKTVPPMTRRDSINSGTHPSSV